VSKGLVRGFDDPDDSVTGEGLVSARIMIGSHAVMRAVHQPGWRWSDHARTVGASQWCQTHHVGYALAGSMHIVMADGTEFDIKAGDVFELPPGHDGWVTSALPYETLDWVGARSWMAARPSAAMVATMVFTDVVDSSGEARRRGDTEWTDLIAALTERTRDIVVEFGGEVVKTTGDGALAVFAAAGAAVRCALELPGVARGLGLDIRVGVHTGEVETVADDIHGLSVHEAARVMGSAGPGEVLVSEVTRVVAAGSGVAFRERGVIALKGIGERRLFSAARD
jgi:class 3 adenylate cyclase